MTEPPVVKRLQVTFNDGLPLGTRGTFTHEGQRWIAVPLDKYSRIVGVTDRLLGALGRVRTQLTQWVSTAPQDAERVVMILQTLAIVETTALAQEKQRAQTS